MGGHTVAPNPGLVDSYPDVYLSTGLVAENHARAVGRSRARPRTHSPCARTQRAIAAIDAGRFAGEIVPVRGANERSDHGLERRSLGEGGAHRRRAKPSFDTDEGPRRDTSLAALAKLAPAFHAAGSVTAGNSSQTSDGASALLVVSDEYARDRGLDAAWPASSPMPRPASPPELFGIGPVPAVRKVLKQAGLTARRHRPGGVQRGVRRPGAGVPGRARRSPPSG